MSLALPTYDDVVEINYLHGGPGAGVTQPDGVHAALGRLVPYFGVDHYPSVWHKAAILLESLSTTQCFLDGNKRTAFVSALTILEVNGFSYRRPVESWHAHAYVLAVASGFMTLEESIDWLKLNYGVQPRWSRALDRVRHPHREHI